MRPGDVSLVGKTFGSWTVLALGEPEPSNKIKRWICRCLCGTERQVRQYRLLRGTAKRCLSCAQRSNGHDLTGRRFGRLTVLGRDMDSDGFHRGKWLCSCDCGERTIVMAGGLVWGGTRSCGCFQLRCAAKFNYKHGHSQTAEYGIWHNAIDRCNNPKNRGYHNYGGRGIAVCRRWLESFDAFLEDMGRRPSPKHSLDRYPNNDGNYEPGNCRWATQSQQLCNTRKTRFLEWRGERAALKEWSRRIGISSSTLWGRLARGWTVERALTVTPNRAFDPKGEQ